MAIDTQSQHQGRDSTDDYGDAVEQKKKKQVNKFNGFAFYC
jgi:hypothetical protein